MSPTEAVEILNATHHHGNRPNWRWIAENDYVSLANTNPTDPAIIRSLSYFEAIAIAKEYQQLEREKFHHQAGSRHRKLLIKLEDALTSLDKAAKAANIDDHSGKFDDAKPAGLIAASARWVAGCLRRLFGAGR